MRSWNLWDSAQPVRLSRLLVVAVAAPLIASFVSGCGSSRPDPLAVVKDGGDDEDETPQARAEQKPAVERAKPAAKPTADGEVAVAKNPGDEVAAGTPPFDLSYLPTDTELILVAQCSDIIRSSLVETVTAGTLAALDPLVDGTGHQFQAIESLRIGIRNLKVVPAPTREALSQRLRGLSLRDIALNPDISSTIVIETHDRVDETPLRKQGDEVRVGSKRYFRLKTNSFQSPCACIQGFRTLIISDEPTILSIVEGKGPPSKPTASFHFAREADLVIAIAPKDPGQIQQWLPSLDLLSADSEDETDATANQPDTPTATSAGAKDGAAVEAQQQAAVGKTANATTETQVASADGATTIEANADETADAATGSAIPAHVTGAALMINLQGGVAISVALGCDSPKSAETAETELQELTAQLKATANDTAALSGGIRELVDSLSTTRLQSVAAVTAAVTPERQVDVMSIPALVLGEEATDGNVTSTSVSAIAEPPDAFAEQILVEGVPPLTSENPLPGMELRGLARWQPSPTGIEGPRQLELGVVAFGGQATSAVATGHFELHEAEVNRLSPLKWLGTSPAYDVHGLNPLDGFVPVNHDSPSSVHPANGVLAVFAVVPPSEPATHLRRFRGQFVMRYYTISEEVHVENLREALRAQSVPPELHAAGVEFDLSKLAGNETLELFYPDSTRIGAVRLRQSNGDPIENVESGSTTSQGKVLWTLTSQGELPPDVALSVTLNSKLAEVVIPFEFANLPIPNVSALSEMQRALLVWTEAEPDSSLPEGLLVEAQARWDNPDEASGLMAQAQGQQFASRMEQPTPRRRDSDDDDRRTGPRRLRPGQKSERPLRVYVDLTGPLVEQADALGEAHVTSIETDFRSELNFEGAYFRQQDATAQPVPLSSPWQLASNGPPGGMRVAFHFTPPLEPIHELARFNGSVRLRISQNRTQALISNLQERTGRRLTTRELTKLGVVLVARIEDDRILVRLLEGKDEQLSELIAVDTFGDPIPAVVTTHERDEGRRVHVLTFTNGLPTGIGLRVIANSSVQPIEVPFRFTKLPVPPASGLPGL